MTQSDVLVAKFSPFNANLIIGGCQNGQILVWDTRSGTEAVHSSSLNGSGHAHPVYSLDFSNASGSNLIVSCSTDGRICTWIIDMLARPQVRHFILCFRRKCFTELELRRLLT